LYGGLWLGFAGAADGPPHSHLDTTLGGQFGIDSVLARHLSLGGEFRIGASRFERTGDRSKLLDIDAKPRFRLPIGHSPVELYAAVPIGLTIPRLADSAEGRQSGKVGWNFGVGAGINVFLTESFALNAEPMWLWHKFHVSGPGSDVYTLKQFSLFLNAVLAF
ncbi:MAG TPA: hypothetical protein VG963_06955, partial [Polyangiaceae bacterium]|nr:hypothetical protein [Polyangiaceae bacterium]